MRQRAIPTPKSFVRGALLLEEVQVALVGRKVSSSRAMSSSKWYGGACILHVFLAPDVSPPSRGCLGTTMGCLQGLHVPPEMPS